MQSLIDTLSDIVGEAFAAEGLDKAFGLVRVSDRPDLAQFQCNGAMAAAKKAGKNPRDVANAVVERISSRTELARVEIAGPGFINLDVTDDVLNTRIAAIAGDERHGVAPMNAGERVIIDFAQPNVAKPMHVAHLRSSIIGESLKRTMRFAGYEVIGDIHLGDWGTHMGMVVGEYIRTGRQDFVLDTDPRESEQVDALLDDLTVLYPQVSARCKEDPDRLKQAQEDTVRIQNREGEYYRLWEIIREVSVIAQKRNFEALDIHFDLWWGESTAHESIAPMVEDLRDKGLAVQSEGAWVIHVARDEDKKEVPPLILYKRDGAVMYGTTDLGTLVDRMRDYNPAKILYVVDQRQHLHFEQVFRAARMGDIVPEGVELTHVGFGTMNGPDGKPFKTRAGGVMKLEDLISMSYERAMARLDEAELAREFPEEERREIARKVGVAAIKFADLQNQRTSDYVFDLDRMMALEGKTGPYLLYQTVRIKSLLRKAGDRGLEPGGVLDIRVEDRALALCLCELPQVIEATLQNYTPHVLCDYAYRLAQTFSSFYGACHILSEEDEGLQASRLALCEATHAHLMHVLELLGIEVPDRM